MSAHLISNIPQFKNTNFNVVLKAVQASPVLDVYRSAVRENTVVSASIISVVAHSLLYYTGIRFRTQQGGYILRKWGGVCSVVVIFL